MVGGGVVSSGGLKGVQYEGKIIVYVIQVCIVVVRGGFFFEYDIGILGMSLVYRIRIQCCVYC